MFSFAGDVVLDPFSGTCATAIAAYRAGRNSISNEIDPFYFDIGSENIDAAVRDQPLFGSVGGKVIEDKIHRKPKAA